MELDDDALLFPCSPRFFSLDLELVMVIALLGFSRAVLEEVTSLLLEVYRAIESELSGACVLLLANQ
jgi:hypothetical protein